MRVAYNHKWLLFVSDPFSSISPKAVLGANQSSDVKQGDFNGDGIDDFALFFYL